MSTMLPYRRLTFLKRHPALSRQAFSHHYEHVHGPLTANQHGLHKYTSRYLQNHVEHDNVETEPFCDAIAMTTQVVREDYSKTFFDEPDYRNITEDEAFLFDLDKVVSSLTRQEIHRPGPTGPYKTLVLLDNEDLAPFDLAGVQRGVMNALMTETASALGGGNAKSRDWPITHVIELWFSTAEQRRAACNQSEDATRDGVGSVLPVREVLLFGLERPWQFPSGDCDA